MIRWFKWIGTVLLVLIVVLFASFAYRTRSRHPDYKVDLHIQSKTNAPLKVGFAAVSITPEIPDSWTDVNGDAEYHPETDTYVDGNNNGVFDAVWIAGFGKYRAANGVHDEIWARTMVIDDGSSRIAIVSLDAVGFMHPDVIDVRMLISSEAKVDYTIVCSTHTHEAPDLMGIWGPGIFTSGVDPDYMQFVKEQSAASVEAAVRALKPALLKFGRDLYSAEDLLIDTRKPEVFDAGVRMIQAIDKETGTTLGTLASWADHPETVWSDNLLITSDFPHFMREGIENGVFHNDSLMALGTGGICVYINGAVGGLMTTHPRMAVNVPFTQDSVKEAGFEKAKAQGDHLALIALDALNSSDLSVEEAGISIRAQTFDLPIGNPIFRLAAFLGVIDNGMSGWMKFQSELSIFSIGPAVFVSIPGEIYPELINGGIEAPDEGDFGIDVQEIPTIRDQMKGAYKFIIGLGNDEVGYIIPKSQWDVDAPYGYGRDNSPYGEENSLGPETAPIIHAELSRMIKEFNGVN